MYKLKPGETQADAAWHILGDRRLTNEVRILNGAAYLLEEKPGPPAKWEADPSALRGPTSGR